LPLPPELRPHKTPRLRDWVWVGIWAGLIGEGAHLAETEASETGKGGSTGAPEGRAWCKQVR